ncbi:MAG: hypothetical protein CSA26_07325 [Desulfobacterales bacterium]|nr:MAG: hypothetical protein CSA26_07325 [Desulfobacterales bacterium]
MKRNGTLFIGLLMVCCFIFQTESPAQAQGGFDLSVKAGTLGGSVEIGVPVAEDVRIRGGLNYLAYSFETTITKINYDFDTDFKSISLLADWHPFSGSFFLTGGVIVNNNTITANGHIDRDAVPFLPEQYVPLLNLVTISGDVSFLTTAPYLGLGWRSNNDESGWGIACELGLMFQGHAEVDNLKVIAPVDVNGIQTVQDFLASQESAIEDEFSYFEYYPVASLVLTYHF